MTTNKKRQRKRNIIWYNPPYSKNVATNIGKKFLDLIEKHFPQQHKLRKLFNKNNVKISYSFMRNMNAIINAHNIRVLNPNRNETEGTCNCRDAKQCPVDGKCLATGSLY